MLVIEVESDGQQAMLAYRYQVAPQTTTHSFEPKKVDFQDPLAMRSSQMGVFWRDKYDSLPQDGAVKLLWEAGPNVAC